VATHTSRGPYKTGVRRRAEIVAAASTVMARRGYAGASLRLIGEAVGMTPAGLLRHFGTKENLLIAVLDDWVEQTIRMRPPSSATGIGYFTRFVDLMRYHMLHPGLIELFLTLSAEASDPSHPARAWVTARHQRIVSEGVEQLRNAVTNGEIAPMSDRRMELEVRGLFAMMDGLELQWIADPRLDLAATFESLLEIVLRRWGATDAPQIGTPESAIGGEPDVPAAAVRA